MYKLSSYNVMIPVKEYDNYLVYNTIKNSLIEVNREIGETLKSWKEGELIPQQELLKIDKSKINKLRRNNILVNSDVDEKKKIYDMREKYLEMVNNDGVLNFTINPTNSCNMRCPYCYEGEHNDNGRVSQLSDKNIQHLADWIVREIENPYTNKIHSIHVTWFGGEPLLKYNVIGKITVELLKICKKYKLNYASNIITNGTLISNKVIESMKKWYISNMQITVDGPPKIHNKNRPLRGKRSQSYEIILNNIAKIPDSIHVGIRINIDNENMDLVETLIQDFEKRKIWPDKKNVTMYLAHKGDLNSNLTSKVKSKLIGKEEFVNLREKMREIQFNHYNKWAKQNGKKRAKMAFLYPLDNQHFCSHIYNIYGISIDDKGFIYKCWEDVNNKEMAIQHISQKYDITMPEYQDYIRHDKYSYSKKCNECKYIPICDVGCMRGLKKGNDDNYYCTDWKYMLRKRLKKQYVLSRKNPEKYQTINEMSKNKK